MSTRAALLLDIDGVFLRLPPATSVVRDRYEMVPGALPFLRWATAEFDCAWLSTRCRSGDPEGAWRAFRLAEGPAISEDDWDTIRSVNALKWTTSKAASIDLESEFFWLDDAPSDDNLILLRRHGVLERLIIVNTHRDRDPLADVQAVLMARLSSGLAL